MEGKEPERFTRQGVYLPKLLGTNIENEDKKAYEKYREILTQPGFSNEVRDLIITNFLLYPKTDLVMCKHCFLKWFPNKEYKYKSPVIWNGLSEKEWMKQYG